MIVFEKIVSVVLLPKLVALCYERIHLQSNQVYVRTHCSCDLLNIIAVFNVLQNGVIRERSLRSKDVCFILHTVLSHIEYIKLLETTCRNSFLPMKNIVTDFVPQHYLLHDRVHTVFEKDEAVLQYNLICPTLLVEVPVDDIDTKLFCHPIRVASATAVNEPVYDFYNLSRSVISQSGSPPCRIIVSDIYPIIKYKLNTVP